MFGSKDGSLQNNLTIMDPADTRRALTGQGNLLGHEQVIQMLLHNMAVLSQSSQHRSRHMVRFVNLTASPGVAAAAGPQANAYACDPEPFDGSLDRCRGFLLHGRVLTWAQAAILFDRPSHAGCTSDRLFSLHQGVRSSAEYVGRIQYIRGGVGVE